MITSSFIREKEDRNMNGHHLSVLWTYETFKSNEWEEKRPTHAYSHIYIGRTYTVISWMKKVLPHGTHHSIPKHTMKREWIILQPSAQMVCMCVFCSSVVVDIFILLAGSAQMYSVYYSPIHWHSHTRSKTKDTSTYTYLHETRWSVQVYASKCHFVLCKNMDDIICVDVLRTYNTVSSKQSKNEKNTHFDFLHENNNNNQNTENSSVAE